jgi:polysaccharide biosynthesis/export protein
MIIGNNHITARRPAGLVLFAAALFLFLPRTADAQESMNTQTVDYKIGAKDLLEVKVFELPELNQTVRVAEDGSVSLSLLGKVEVKGLTAQELEKRLASLLDQKYTQAAHVTVFIREYQKVSVFGAVGKPGNYELVGPTTLLQMISQAGGLSAEAAGQIYIFRQGQDGKQEKVAVDLEQLIIRGNQELNINIQPNDVINVPMDRMLTVYVYGEVRLPGAIQFKQSKQVTIIQAISQAGGLSEWASKSGITVKRKDRTTGKEMRLAVNLKKIIAGKATDLILEDGDIIIIP